LRFRVLQCGNLTYYHHYLSTASTTTTTVQIKLAPCSNGCGVLHETAATYVGKERRCRRPTYVMTTSPTPQCRTLVRRRLGEVVVRRRHCNKSSGQDSSTLPRPDLPTASIQHVTVSYDEKMN